MYCCWKSRCQEGNVVIPLTSLTPPHFYACSKPGSGFPTSYVMAFFCSNYLRREVIVCFVDIGGIVDHHCLNFLFITKIYNINQGCNGLNMYGSYNSCRASDCCLMSIQQFFSYIMVRTS